MRIKHWHEWKFYCTFNGGGTNGAQRICDICGARKGFGCFGGDQGTLRRGYARHGQKMVWK